MSGESMGLTKIHINPRFLTSIIKAQEKEYDKEAKKHKNQYVDDVLDFWDKPKKNILRKVV